MLKTKRAISKGIALLLAAVLMAGVCLSTPFSAYSLEPEYGNTTSGENTVRQGTEDITVNEESGQEREHP